MLVLNIIFFIVVLWVFIYGGLRLNEFSDRRYGYLPLNVQTGAASVVPYVLLFIAALFGDSNPAHAEEMALNAAVLHVVTGVWIIALFINIARKSNIFIAIVAFFYLAIIGFLLALALHSALSKKSNDRGYR